MGDSLPLISCVMPTTDDREVMARWSSRCFDVQTYPNRELVVLLDAGSIPVKRNRANAIAKGELIAHFDSDDWSDPERLMLQYRFMKETGKAVVGFHSILMAEEANGGQAFRFNGPYPRERFCLGTSLLYTKAFWQAHPFDERQAIGSDVAFIEAAYSAKELATIDGGSLMVARIHDGNTSKKRRDNCTNYQPIYWNELPEGFRNQ